MKNDITIKFEVNMLRNKYEHDELEQYTRRDNILIFGVAEDLSENLADKMIKTATDINVNISQNDMSTIHRLGKLNPTNAQTKPRPIICCFVRRVTKDNMMKNRKKLKDIPQYQNKIFINEDLTLLKSKLLNYTKSIQGVTRVNSNNGKIYANMQNGSVIVLDSADDLHKLGLEHKNIDYSKLGLGTCKYNNTDTEWTIKYHIIKCMWSSF